MITAIVAAVVGSFMALAMPAFMNDSTITVHFNCESREVCNYTIIEEEFMSNFESEIGSKVEIVDSSDICDVVSERNGKVVVERCIGLVTDDVNGDGVVLNCSDPNYNYISFRHVPDICEGTVILTYLVYNPKTNEADDIIDRFDFVLDRRWED